MKTIYLKPSEVERRWCLIDAEGVPMGKVAVKAAELLRGKHKPSFAPHQEMGDFVVIINAGKALLSGNKKQDKLYYHHSGYSGSLKAESYTVVTAKKPTFPMERAIRGMLPKGPLGNKLYRNIRVYAGDEHPHQAQEPLPVSLQRS